VFFHILYFCCLGILWVPPLYFGWPCLVTSLWNSHWLLAKCLLSGCSCGPYWVPWYNLSLLCWSLDLAICFLHFPLYPVLIYLEGRVVSISFSSSYNSTWYCFCLCSMCNSVLANLQQ
jgi:hypothetical protein